jgi:hypothetical protein
MKKNSNSWERIAAVMKYYGLNKNSFSVAIGSNNVTIGRIINEKRKPIQSTLDKIVRRFPEISMLWLLTGDGEMLKSNNMGHTISGNNSPIIGNIQQSNIVGSNVGSHNQINVGNGNTLIGGSIRETNIKQSGRGNAASIYGNANNAAQQQEKIVILEMENAHMKIELQRLNSMVQAQEYLLQSKDKIIALLERQAETRERV